MTSTAGTLSSWAKWGNTLFRFLLSNHQALLFILFISIIFRLYKIFKLSVVLLVRFILDLMDHISKIGLFGKDVFDNSNLLVMFV